MDFYTALDQVVDLLRRRGRVSYRALKRQFALDDELLADLKAELRYARYPVVEDEDQGLIWTGETAPPSEHTPPPPRPETEHALHSERPLTEPRVPEAERRQLTVLFCDLVDSTALAGQLDPEEWREVVRAYQSTCAAVIQRFDGYIAQYLGDGLLIYFGYPQAHEDDARRAVRAGLGMVAAMQKLNARLMLERGIGLAVRLGIHTGLVVVGEIGGGGRHEQLALGETPNVAARLQGLAEPNTVVISAVTHRLVQGFFTADNLGTRTLKGVPEPMPVYRVLEESSAQTRLDVAATRGLTPLVGRESEVTLLLERWAQVKDSLGQVVLLSGEAGIGKSRLVEVVKERLADEPHVWLEWRCSPYYQHSALHPVIEHLHRLLRWRQDDSPQEKLRKLEGVLGPYGFSLPDVVPLLASLLLLPLPDQYTALTLTPQRQRQKTLEAILVWLLEEARRQPVLLIVEDLHWVDPSTLEFLSLLIDQGPTARILTVLTCRQEFRPPWGFRAHLTSLTLGRLPRAQTEVMVERVAGGRALPDEVRRQVVAKTDGVPLFVEELTKMVLESGLLQEREGYYELMGPLAPLAIPETLHDSLMARLDRLATVKEMAQLGATLGRAFSYELLQAVSLLEDEILQPALEKLVEAELLYQRGVPPQATYLFKHALIQEAAYQCLLKSRRQQYHQRIARVLEGRFPEIAEAQPELLAYHFTEAGLMAQAFLYWQRAGQRAIERSANLEAIPHLRKGLEVLQTLPATAERSRHELALHIALGVPLIATKGYGDPEVEHTYRWAQELCQQVEEDTLRFQALRGIWNCRLVRAELPIARDLGVQLMRLAERVQDPALLVEVHRALGTTLLFLGELTEARIYLEQGIALYDPQHHRALAFRYGADPGIVCRLYAGWVFWLLGYPDQAGQKIEEGLILARELAHIFSLAFALNHAALIRMFLREAKTAGERADISIAFSTEQGIAQWLAQGTVLRGWALAMQGQGPEGTAEIYRGMAAWQATGAALTRPWYLAQLAEAYGQEGKVEEGLNTIAEALVPVNTTEERWWEAELYRLKGELLLACSAAHHTEAEACFHRSLDIARHQQAKSLELRAAMSLSRLWQQQGKRDEARELLTPIYGWFTEGFDTADLQEAKALLDNLS
jgi:class 3 adenylate cyclase/predicted ATPase